LVTDFAGAFAGATFAGALAEALAGAFAEALAGALAEALAGAFAGVFVFAPAVVAVDLVIRFLGSFLK
jgi:hypothetical protein